MRSSLLFVVACSLVGISVAITIVDPDFDVRRTIPSQTGQGLTFTPNGDLYASTGGSNCLYRYPGAANLPIGGTIAATACIPVTPSVDLTNIVSTQAGKIVTIGGYEIDPSTGIATQRWTPCGETHGLAVDPQNGNIYIGSIGGPMWIVPNPDTHPGLIPNNCGHMYYNGATIGTGFDGITVGPDGTIYATGYQIGKMVIISGTPQSYDGLGSLSGTLIAAVSSQGRLVDGISICSGNGTDNYAITSGQSASTITRYNLTGPGGAPTYALTPVANNVGGYLDFTTVDPHGCIWGSDFSFGVYRITNSDGTCGCNSAQINNLGNTCGNGCAVKTISGGIPNTGYSTSSSSTGSCAGLNFA